MEKSNNIMAQEQYKRALIWVLLSCFPLPAWSADNVHVAGLFKDQAMVVIDGARRLMVVGGQSYGGVRLVSATSDSAVLEIDGVRGVYAAESRIQMPLGELRRAETQIWRDRSGLFQTIGSINGQLFAMLVDTGATQVAMNEHHARRLGIDYVIVGSPARVATASSEEYVYRINLKTLSIGAVQLQDVSALVIPGNYPDKILLGMSFLKRMELQNQGDRLVLRKKF